MKTIKKAIKNFLKLFIPPHYRPALRTHYKKLRFFGLRYKCSFCRSHVRTMFPFGYDFPVLKEKNIVGGYRREHAVCPICESFDRERLVHLYLRHKTDLFKKPHRLLHLAPEKRIEKILKRQRHLDYLTADLYPDRVMVQMDITDIHYPDNSFDAIICNHVLEHVPDDHKAMSEFFRVLKPGGWAILQVPISLSLDTTYEDFSITSEQGREKAFGQNDHVRIYAKDYATRLEQAGFKLAIFDWHSDEGRFGGPRNKYSLYWDESLYLAKKP